MAKDGVFFKFLSDVHPKYKTPAKAMIFQSAWAIVLLLTIGNFRQLMGYVVFMDIIFMTLAGASVFILRYKKPDLERPVKVVLYPVVPVFFVIISTVFVGIVLVNKGTGSIPGLLVLGLGGIVYFIIQWLKRNKKN